MSRFFGQVTVWGAVLILGWLATGTRARAQEATRTTTSQNTIRNSLGMPLVLIPAGEFVMGSPESEEGHAADETQRRVRIARAFYLGQHEVTVGQFRAFVESTGHRTELEREARPGFGFDELGEAIEILPRFNWKHVGFQQTDSHPVVNVGWSDAVAFCGWLSEKEKRIYRLPTEAEWEYACRAGTSTRYWCGDDEESLRGVANISDAAFLAKYKEASWSIEWSDGFPFTSPVGSFRANPWGLYDVHGNAWEWCADWYAAEYYKISPPNDPPGPSAGERRVLRGGCFTNRNKFVRSADRDSYRPKYRYNFTGLRVVLESTDPS